MTLRPVQDAARAADAALRRALRVAEGEAAMAAASAAAAAAAAASAPNDPSPSSPPTTTVIPVESSGVAAAVAMRAQLLLAQGKGLEAVRAAESAVQRAAPTDSDAHRLVAALLREVYAGGDGGAGEDGEEAEGGAEAGEERGDEDQEEEEDDESAQRRRQQRLRHRLRDAAASTLALDPWCSGAAHELRLASGHCAGCCAARARAALRRCDLRLAAWREEEAEGEEDGEDQGNDDDDPHARELGWGGALDALVRAAQWAVWPQQQQDEGGRPAAPDGTAPPSQQQPQQQRVPRALRDLFSELSARRAWWPSMLPSGVGGPEEGGPPSSWRRLGERAGVAALCAGSGNPFTSAAARAVGLVPVGEEEEEEAEEEDAEEDQEEEGDGNGEEPRPARRRRRRRNAAATIDGGFDTSGVPAWAQDAATALLRGVRAARELERGGLV
jgi:hypothetical protein